MQVNQGIFSCWVTLIVLALGYYLIPVVTVAVELHSVAANAGKSDPALSVACPVHLQTDKTCFISCPYH